MPSVSTFFGVKTDKKMSNAAFRMMSLIFKTMDFLFGGEKRVEKRVGSFGIQQGFTVIDYGCGPGRYIATTSRLVGDSGKVYAVDIHELALKTVTKRIERYGLTNVELVLASPYSCDVADQSADAVYVLDAFHMIKEPTRFLTELHRLVKRDGFLIIDDGHQTHDETKAQIADSLLWSISEESEDHLRCTPIAG